MHSPVRSPLLCRSIGGSRHPSRVKINGHCLAHCCAWCMESMDPLFALQRPLRCPLIRPRTLNRAAEYLIYTAHRLRTQRGRRGVGATVRRVQILRHCTTHCCARGHTPRIKGSGIGLRKETLPRPLPGQWAVHGVPHAGPQRAPQWVAHALHRRASRSPAPAHQAAHHPAHRAPHSPVQRALHRLVQSEIRNRPRNGIIIIQIKMRINEQFNR